MIVQYDTTIKQYNSTELLHKVKQTTHAETSLVVHVVHLWYMRVE